LHSNSFLQKKDETNFSFHVTINMYLQRGKTITPEQEKRLNCERLKNNIYGGLDVIQGKKFEIPPDYSILTAAKEEKDKEDKDKGEKKGGSKKRRNKRETRKSRKMKKQDKTK
jgi:hypothetical protein